MKVLILGGTGMLGHKTCQVLAGTFDTWTSVRTGAGRCARYDFLDPAKTVCNADLSTFAAARDVLERVGPHAVVNCVGVLKQTLTPESTIQAVTLNALMPHWLDKLRREMGFRLIQIGTDCVFSGRKGMYTEDDLPDADDVYGRSKLLGEVTSENCLTLRTSMIGRELSRTVGLLEWFLSQSGKTVRGWSRAVFSGFTTQGLAEILSDILQHHADLTGLYHISSEPINKYDLLCRIADACKLDIRVEPDDSVVCDRSLDSTRLRKLMGYEPPSWNEMLANLAGELDQYRTWRAAD